MLTQFITAVFLQISGTVGAGIFTLPYVFSRSNIYFSVTVFIFLVFITGALNHFYSDIVLSTSGHHQLSGYANHYLGKNFKKIALINILLLAIGAITAYQKLFGDFIVILFPSFRYSLLLFIELSIVWFLFSQSRSRSLPWHSLLSTIIVAIPIFLFSFSSFYGLRFTDYEVSPSFLFYGPAIFALSGFTIIPEIKSRFLPKASHLGLFITSILYLLFIFSVITLSPNGVTPDALVGISHSYPIIAKIVAIFGLLITFQATQNFLLVIKELFFHDFAFSSSASNVFSFIVLLLSVILNPISLVLILSLTGHITMFISALIICLIRLCLPHKFFTEFVLILVIISFTAGLLAAFI